VEVGHAMSGGWARKGLKGRQSQHIKGPEKMGLKYMVTKLARGKRGEMGVEQVLGKAITTLTSLCLKK